jgi:hypothetical protein
LTVKPTGGHFGEGEGLIFEAALAPLALSEITASSISGTINPSRFTCSPNEMS